MAKSELVVGLDIGTTKVCTLVAEIDERGRPSVIGVGVTPSQGVRRGVVVDMESAVAAIRESVDRAQRMAGAEVHAAVVGVTGEHIASLNSRGVGAITHPERIVGRSDVERVLDNARLIVLPPDREILHVLPRGYALDGQDGIRNPVGMCGTRLEVETHIVTGATSFLRNVAACVERASLTIEELVLEPIATGEAVLLPAERELGVALVDVGGGTSDIAVFRGGEICFSSVVPVGGEYVTRDIAAGLRTTLEEAERIKREFGRACVGDVPEAATFALTPLGASELRETSQRELAGIIEARVAELFDLIRQELRRGGFEGRLPGGLVLSGGGALLVGLADFAASALDVPTRVGAPGAVDGVASIASDPSYATAVGLVLWGARSVSAAPSREPNGLLAAIASWMRRSLRGL